MSAARDSGRPGSVKARSERRDPAPSWRLRFENRRGYLYAEVTGPEDSVDITIAYWREIAAECARRHARRVLVSDRLHGELANPEDLGSMVRGMLGHGLETVRIAFHEPEPSHLAGVEHAELHAREAGFTLRVFGDEHQAEIWLRYGDI